MFNLKSNKDKKKPKKISIFKKNKVEKKDFFHFIKRKKKEPEKEKFTFSIFETVIMSFTFLLFGIVVGYILTYGTNTISGKKMSKELIDFINVYENLSDNYYNELDEKKLLDAAIEGMMGAIDDPYSGYMNQEVAEQFDEEISGKYVGIGVTVSHANETNEIIEVAEGYAASKAGLQVGDLIVAVDGNDVTKVFGDDLSKLIRGEVDTKVKVTVLRNNERIDYELTRVSVDLVSVTSYTVNQNNHKVGVITISNFASNTFNQFDKELKRLEKEKIDSLVIDVRDNLGGQLTQVKNILNLFFKKDTVLFKIKVKDQTTLIKAFDNKYRKYPVAVLVNGSSASASEVLAACFKDNYKKAYIVGENTYGKGTVQKTKDLGDGTKIKYTTEKWLTPKGKWLNGDGLTPDYKVSNGMEYYNNPIIDNDAQMKKALDLLTK